MAARFLVLDPRQDSWRRKRRLPPGGGIITAINARLFAQNTSDPVNGLLTRHFDHLIQPTPLLNPRSGWVVFHNIPQTRGCISRRTALGLLPKIGKNLDGRKCPSFLHHAEAPIHSCNDNHT